MRRATPESMQLVTTRRTPGLKDSPVLPKTRAIHAHFSYGPDIMASARPTPNAKLLSALLACSTALVACGGGEDDDLAQVAAQDTGTAMAAAAKPAKTLPTPTLAGLSLAAVAGATAPEVSTSGIPVTVATFESLETIAQDAAGTSVGNAIYNHWGGHQPRVVVHADGTLRALYLYNDPMAGLSWRLMKRSPGPSPTWVAESSGQTVDDVFLLRDPTTDAAMVVAWPGSRPTIYSLPSMKATTIPGSWQVMPQTSRHYTAAGIGADGTLCLKASVELPTDVPTSNTATVFTCGKPATSAWFDQQTKHIGERYAYDYLFPTEMQGAQWLAASAQRDLYKLAAGLPSLSPASYVFDGIRGWSTAAANVTQWSQGELVAPLASPSTTATSASTQNQIDALLDSRGRMLTLHFTVSPSDHALDGFHLTVASTDGRQAKTVRLATLPTYGSARLFEDSKHRLWLLYSNAGTQATQFVLYRLNESSANPMESTLSVGDKVDFGSSVWPHLIVGTPTLAVSRGGNDIGLRIQGAINVCANTFDGPISPRSDCYGANPASGQRMLRFSIRLPD